VQLSLIRNDAAEQTRPSAGKVVCGIRLAAMLATTACAHSDAFQTTLPPRDNDPFDAAIPVRLTYDAGIDGFQSFSPDGSKLLFAFQPRDRPDNDRCIGVMPAGGGPREEFCDNTGVGAFLTDALEYPAVNAQGDLLYARYVSGIGDFIANTGETTLRLARIEAPREGRIILQLPTMINAVGMTRIGTIRWADATTFYFVAEEMTLARNPISRTFHDTVTFGRGLVRGRVNGTEATFEAVNGIVDASGFDLSAGRDTIFFTRTNDSRLYAVAVSASVARVVHESPRVGGRPRVLRDPVRTGNLVLAVSQDIDLGTPPLYPAGLAPNVRIERIRTDTGEWATLLAAGGLFPAFGRLAVSPDGCTLVSEFRRFESVSFTTDLHAICLGQGVPCRCG